MVGHFPGASGISEIHMSTSNNHSKKTTFIEHHCISCTKFYVVWSIVVIIVQ